MKGALVLTDVSEDISLTDPEKIRSFLVFDYNGEELRVPVSRDAVASIVSFLYKKDAAPKVAAAVEKVLLDENLALEEHEEDDLPAEAEQFGGDFEGGEEEPEEEDPISQFELPRAPETVPQSEEEVPSL